MVQNVSIRGSISQTGLETQKVPPTANNRKKKPIRAGVRPNYGMIHYFIQNKYEGVYTIINKCVRGDFLITPFAGARRRCPPTTGGGFVCEFGRLPCMEDPICDYYRLNLPFPVVETAHGQIGRAACEH